MHEKWLDNQCFLPKSDAEVSLPTYFCIPKKT